MVQTCWTRVWVTQSLTTKSGKSYDTGRLGDTVIELATCMDIESVLVLVEAFTAGVPFDNHKTNVGISLITTSSEVMSYVDKVR